VAAPDPAVFVAVTVARSLKPVSEGTGTYVLVVAVAIGAQDAMSDVVQRSH